MFNFGENAKRESADYRRIRREQLAGREDLFRRLEREVGHALPKGQALDIYDAVLRMIVKGEADLTLRRENGVALLPEAAGQPVILTGIVGYPGSRVSDVKIAGYVGTFKVGEGEAVQVENANVIVVEGNQ